MQSKKPQQRSPSIYEKSPVTPGEVLDSWDDLNPLLVRTKDELPKVCYGPTYYHKLLPLLADEEPTLDRPVPHDIPPPIPTPGSEVARVAINDFLNSCFRPVRAEKESWNFTSTVGNEERPDTCSLAEGIFIETLNSMECVTAPDDCPYQLGPSLGWTIIADEDLEPIAVRKYRGTPSALSLVPITINGRIYPAGSLLGVQLHKEHNTTTDRYYTDISRRGVTSTSNIASIRFLRLSGFAHSHEERMEVFSHTRFNSIGGTLSIDQIADLARECMPLSERFGFAEDTAKGKVAKLLSRLGRTARTELSSD